MAKNIKIKEVIDNSVKVNIVHSPKMAECVDKMTELDDKSFSKVVRLAKSYIRVNKLANKLMDLAKDNYKELEKADKAILSQKAAIYA